MKKTLFTFIILFSAIYNAEAYYIPIDNIELPKSEKQWSAITNPEAGFVTYKLQEQYIPQGRFPAFMEFSSRDLTSYQIQNHRWKKTLEKNLKAKIVSKKEIDAENTYEILYQKEFHLMPVTGVQYAKAVDDRLYVFTCEAEDMKKLNIHETCEKTYKKIKWSDQLTVKTDSTNLNFTKFVEQMKSFDTSLLPVEKNNLFENFSPELKKYKIYTYLLILESTLNPLEKNQNKIFTNHFKRLKNFFEIHPDKKESMVSLIDLQLNYLNKPFTDSKAKTILQTNQAPYWVVGMWLKNQDSETAINLLKRDSNDFTLKDFLFAEIYYNSNQCQAALPHLTILSKNKNQNSTAKIAYCYYQTQDFENAEKWANKTLKSSENNAYALYVLAKLNDQKQKKDDAAKLYTQLIGQPQLPEEISEDTFLSHAQMIMNPDEKIDAYKKALTNNPASLPALYNLGKLYLVEKNDKTRSIYYFEKYLAKSPKQSDKHKELEGIIDQMKKEERTQNYED